MNSYLILPHAKNVVLFVFFCIPDIIRCLPIFVMRCTIWYYLYNLKNVKNTHGSVLILVKLQAKAGWDSFSIKLVLWFVRISVLMAFRILLKTLIKVVDTLKNIQKVYPKPCQIYLGYLSKLLTDNR